MNKKGFTLMEVLAVLVILGVILGMVVVNSVYFANKRKQKDYDNIVSLIEKNADVLVNTDNEVYNAVNNKLTQANDECKIEYERLEDARLMDKGTINPKTGKTINKESYIKVILNEDYDFIYTFVNVDELEENTNIDSCLSTN